MFSAAHIFNNSSNNNYTMMDTSNVPCTPTCVTVNHSCVSGSSFSTTGKNTTIILPGDKKPKIIGGGKKTEIKADVVGVVLKSIVPVSFVSI